MFWKIREKLNKLKMQKQRAKKGFCVEDTWSVYDWFLNTAPKILTELNKNRMGHPTDMTDKEWGDIIDRMIFCFTEANDYTCSQTNSIDYDKNKDKWCEREIEIVDYRDKMKNEGLELFSKYFWNLWD